MADELDALLGAAADYFGDDALDFGTDLLGDVLGAEDASKLLDVAGRVAGGDGGSLLEEFLGDDARELLGGALGDGVMSLGAGALDRAIDEVGGEVSARVRDELGDEVSAEIDDVLRSATPAIAWGEGVAMEVAAVAAAARDVPGALPEAIEGGMYDPDVDDVAPGGQAFASEDAVWPEARPEWDTESVSDTMDRVDDVLEDMRPTVPDVPDEAPQPIDPSVFEIELDTADAYESSVDSLFEGA